MRRDSGFSYRVTIAGYYGAGNTGDEAILGGIIRSLREEGICDITVMSWNPETTHRTLGVKSLYIGARFHGLRRIFEHLKHSDLFILGGGGLLQDASFRVVPFWMSRVLIALLSGTPVMYYALGVGPLKTRFARRVVGAVSNRVKRITVRDRASKILLHACGVSGPRVEVTSDPALSLRVTTSGKSRLVMEGISLEQCTLSIAVCLRSWKGSDRFLPALSDCLDKVRRSHPVRYIFVPFQDREDRSISEHVLASLAATPSKHENRILRLEHTAEQISAILSEMDGVIAMRLHATILGALSNVPVFGLVYDPKVQRFMERASIAHYATLDGLREQTDSVAERMISWIDTLQSQRERMKPAVEEMIREAKRSEEVLRELLNTTSGSGWTK